MYQDHHLHFEGSVSFQALAKLLEKNSNQLLQTDVKRHFSHLFNRQTASDIQIILRKEKRDILSYLTKRFVFKKPAKNLREFISRLPTDVIRWSCLSVDDLEFLFTQSVKEYLKTHNDIELLFCPRALENLSISEEEVVRLFNSIIKSKYSKKIRLVLSLRRDKGDLSLKYVKRCTQNYYLDCIKKIDISGDEGCSLSKFKASLDVLSASRFKLSTHIGETSVNDIDFMLKNYPRFTQFNHGVYIFHDKGLVKIAKERNIYFTFCPLSSYYTGSMSKLQIKKVLSNFLKYDLNFSLGSDDPAIICGDLSTHWATIKKEGFII